MSRSAQVIHNLRILELPPDAAPSEVQGAFRRLARACHPDVAGRRSARKFEQIASAYAFLKGLDEEEFHEEASQQARSAENEKARRERAAREAEAEAARAREAAVDSALGDGERAVAEFLSRVERETAEERSRELILRLSSAVPQVRHLALSSLGILANRGEILDAAFNLLQTWDIDEKTARLVSLLPLEPENRRALARRLAGRAAAMPSSLLAYLLRLNPPHQRFDRPLWEQYIQESGPDGVTLLLRHWPQDSFVSGEALKRLLSSAEEGVLVPLLCAMKQRGVQCPVWARETLSAHLTHPSPSVRLWASAMLPRKP